MKRPRCTCCKIRMKGHKKQRCASQTVIEYEDGSVYTGPTYDGVPSGHGRLESASGRFYKGDFFEGKRHGSGVEFGDDGHSYDGEWRSGVYHGHGHSLPMVFFMALVFLSKANTNTMASGPEVVGMVKGVKCLKLASILVIFAMVFATAGAT